MIRRVAIASVPVFALAAGGALAQSNSSGVYQYGWQNSASIDQALGSGLTNNATINQGVGGDGTASYSGQAQITQIGGAGSQISSDIVQNGSNQYARTYQNGGPGGTQTSGVTQSNSRNSAIVNQYTSAATDSQQSVITQTGAGQPWSWNTVFVNQYGPNDNSTIYQSGYGNDGTTSSAAVLGMPGHGPTFNVSTGISVQQDVNSANTSVANQYSNYSGIYVYQASWDGIGGTNQSTVNQFGSGNYNFVGLDQRASSGGTSSSIINQNGGSYNAAYFMQWGTAGSTLYSDIEQSGANNLTQLWQTPAYDGSSQYSYISQTGQNGLIHNEQDGINDYAYVVQTGQGSDGTGQSRYFQLGPVSGTMQSGVSVYQDGQTANNAKIYQYSDYSGASISQSGSSGTNNSVIYQYGGSSDFAGNMQVADGGGINGSTITQNAGGSGNLAGAIQMAGAGMTNSSTITQTGSYNTALVYQHR